MTSLLPAVLSRLTIAPDELKKLSQLGRLMSGPPALTEGAAQLP
jgi:hypothetical protein